MRLSAIRQRDEEQEAVDYAWAILNWTKGGNIMQPDWSARNDEIIGLYSKTALIRIKRRAWQIVEEWKARNHPAEAQQREGAGS